MGERRALIFTGGDWQPDGPQAGLVAGVWDWVICADSGARHALAAGIRPDVLIGDFDSLDPRDRGRLEDVPTLSFSSDKDKTDTHLAVDWALAKGASHVVIAGGLGGRFDHALANAHLLVTIHGEVAGRGKAPRATGVVTDGRQAVYLLVDQLELSAPAGTVLTVLPLTPRLEGLSERGLRWELTRRDVALGDTLTVSNEFTDKPARLSLGQGLALVIVGAPL